MDPQTVAQLRSAFAAMSRRKPDVAALFYRRLFEVAPALKPLFTRDPRQQQRKLTAALAQIVAALDAPEKLAGQLTRMGKRHVTYGAQPAHYALVGDVLLWTFAQVLGEQFTPELRAGWTAAYQAVADIMIKAGAKPEARAGAARSSTGRRTPRPSTAPGRLREAAARGKRQGARKTRSR